MRVGPPSLVVLGLAASLLASGCDDGAEPEPPAPAPLARTTAGTFRVAVGGSGGGDGAAAPPLHTVYRKGPGYDGVADNDLRGFLDGGFLYGWNQPLQGHVRVGRRHSSPRFGETELFRVLMRWSELGLPRDATVGSASLTWAVELRNARPLRLLLYAVRGDWEPGRGGVRGDNSSPPAPGEVWWGARAHEREPWGLPGVGFASDVHPRADTPSTALAETVYHPDDATLRFASEGLARELERAARRGEPLRLLLKVSDALEDTPDTQLTLYSSEHGDRFAPARRPRLSAVWRSTSMATHLDAPILLEPGRVLRTGRLPAGAGSRVAASFEPAPGSGPLSVELRGGAGGETGPWTPLATPRTTDGFEWVELRAIAAENPIALGRPFETWLRDTWLPSGPPGEQELVFFFDAPSGARHQRRARYVGDYRFEVDFEPDELGVWRYHFEHRFEHETRGPDGTFHVLPLEREGVLEALRALLAEAEAGALELDENRVPRLAPRFWRLERALLSLETPESFASDEGLERRALLRRLREVLGGRPVPDEIPLRPAKRDW